MIWLLGVFILLGLSIFKGVLSRIADILGVSYAPSLLFAFSALFLLMIMLSFAVSITSLVRRNRDLAQRLALLEWYVKQLQRENRSEDRRNTSPANEEPDPDQAFLEIKDEEVKLWK